MEASVINNRFILHNKIGSGGYASVFLAYDKIKKDFVAIKILNVKASENDKAYKMFYQEALTLASITNPNVVRIYSSGVHNDNPYLVMEYVKGESLKDTIKKNSYLLVDEVYAYMKQIINGLSACHNVNIVHRDIKPQNIIKKPDGTIVLIDFGIALITEKDKNLYEEDGSSITGTVHYLAPELVKMQPATVQSDIYALGIMMYEMFSAKYPFDMENGEDKIALATKHVYNAFPSLRKICPDVPQSFENIINKCCKKDPKERYQNVNELGLDLMKAYDEYKNPKPKVSFWSKLFKRKQK